MNKEQEMQDHSLALARDLNTYIKIMKDVTVFVKDETSDYIDVMDRADLIWAQDCLHIKGFSNLAKKQVHITLMYDAIPMYTVSKHTFILENEHEAFILFGTDKGLPEEDTQENA